MRWIDDFIQDLRHGSRLMMKTPGFTLAAALTIALGIGSVTAIFSVVYGVVLQPLPYREPERLVGLWTRMAKVDRVRSYVGAANYRDWRDQSATLEDIALVRFIANYNLTGGSGEPERILGARSTANLLSVLGVQPQVGRFFTAENESPGAEHVAVLSHKLWKRRFGGDPGIVGRSIELNLESYTVLGVMGPDFRYPSRDFDLWVPLYLPPQALQSRLSFDYLAVGRLKPGVAVAQAQADLDAVSARLARQYKANEGVTALVAPMRDDTALPVRSALYILLGAVGCLLLIGCVNVANLFLALGLARGHERAVRAALGASPLRLLTQSVAEILPTIAIGGALGVWGAVMSLDALISLLPAATPRIDEIHVSAPVLVFSAITLLGACALVAFWPAAQTIRSNPVDSLKEEGRSGSGSRAQSRLRELLVAAEVALTVLLVAGAFLFARSFVTVRSVKTGFEPARALSMYLAIPRVRYPQDRDVAAFAARVIERVRAVPGVEAAGIVNRLPIGGGPQTGSIEFDGGDPAVPRLEDIDWRLATPGYFQAIGIPLIEGRLISESDSENAPHAALIDAETARKVWPRQSPIGKRVRIPIAGQPWAEIVGVVGRIQNDGLDAGPRTQVYWSYRQWMQDRVALVVRTTGEPSNWTPAVLARIRELDPQQPVYGVSTMEDVVDRSLSQRRTNMILVAAFAVMSLLLASIGIYGVTAYSVRQRLREFGIRIALGADSPRLVRMVVLRASAVAGAGAVLGMVATAALGRWISSSLYGVSPIDWRSYSASALALVGVAALASYAPALRAARVSPIQSLRAD